MKAYSLFQAARTYATRTGASAAKKAVSVKPQKPAKIVTQEMPVDVPKKQPKQEYTPVSDGWGSEDHESPYVWGKNDYRNKW